MRLISTRLISAVFAAVADVLAGALDDIDRGGTLAGLRQKGDINGQSLRLVGELVLKLLDFVQQRRLDRGIGGCQEPGITDFDVGDGRAQVHLAVGGGAGKDGILGGAAGLVAGALSQARQQQRQAHVRLRPARHFAAGEPPRLQRQIRFVHLRIGVTQQEGDVPIVRLRGLRLLVTRQTRLHIQSRRCELRLQRRCPGKGGVIVGAAGSQPIDQLVGRFVFAPAV